MIRKTWLGMFVLVLIFQGVFQAQAQDVQKAEEIKFRISDEPVQQLHGNYKNPQDITHVATIRLIHGFRSNASSVILYGMTWSPGNLSNSFPDLSWTTDDLLATEAGKKVSPQQKAFWESESKPAESARPGAVPAGLIPPSPAVPGSARGRPMRVPPISVADRRPYPDEEGYICFEVAAVSEADASIAAEAFMELLTAHVNKQHEALLKFEENSKAYLAELKAKADVSEKALEEVSSSIDEIKKGRNYRTLADAEQEMRQLRNTITDLEIKAAGIQEKIAAIRKQQENLQGKRNQAKLTDALEELAIKESIELAGILASKNTASAVVDEANKFCLLKDMAKEHETKSVEFSEQLTREENVLKRIQAYLIPVEDILQIADNEIVVSPVMQTPAITPAGRSRLPTGGGGPGGGR